MADRPQLTPFPVITNGSMAGSLTSAVTIVQKISMLSYGYSWTGTSPVGTISVQVSNDYTLDSTGNPGNAGTWNTISFYSAGSVVTSVAVTGNTGNGFIDIFQTGAFAMRTIYTRTSGTGTLQCMVAGKVA